MVTDDESVLEHSKRYAGRKTTGVGGAAGGRRARTVERPRTTASNMRVYCLVERPHRTDIECVVLAGVVLKTDVPTETLGPGIVGVVLRGAPICVSSVTVKRASVGIHVRKFVF